MANHVNFYVGNSSGDDRYVRQSVKQGKQKAGKSLFVGNANLNTDPIAVKRKEAQKKAMRVVGDAFASEKKLDQDMQDRREHITQLNEEMGIARKALNQIEADKDAMREQYGVKTDSKEQQDLLLLEKRNESLREGSTVTLSEDEKEALAKIEQKGLTEYQSRALKMDGYGAPYRITINENKEQILEENAIIRGVKLERLKSHGMEDAQKEADSIKTAASGEIIGMLVEEAKDHVDENTQELKENADKKAEKEQEQEEQLAAIREKKKQLEEQADPDKKEGENQLDVTLPNQSIVQLSQTKTEVQTEVQNIVEKMKLVAEDIKGAMVDKEI